MGHDMSQGADLYTPFLTDPETSAIMGAEGLVRSMLLFEVALARAEARLGLIPQDAAAQIAEAAQPGAIPMADLAAATAVAGNPASPLVRMLTALVPGEAARHVHWGATSQDAMDTGLVLQLREVLALFRMRLAGLGDMLAVLAGEYRVQAMPARTLLQQALPTTFGAKAAAWLMPLIRHMQRLDELEPRLLVVQLGGAAGTRAAFGHSGDAVARALGEELGLGNPPMPWHTSRDRIAEFACVCGVICGSLGKIAQDVILLMQTEIGEVLEGAGPGKGGSSTLPHKRNPVAAHAMLAIARLVPPLVSTLLNAQVQAHERAAGDWPPEWIALPALVGHTGAALAHALAMIPHLEISTERMRANLDSTKGLVMAEAVMMALALHIGRGAAHHLVEAASRSALRQERHLRDVLAGDPAVTTYLDDAALRSLFEPGHYLGEAVSFADKAVAIWGQHRAGVRVQT